MMMIFFFLGTCFSLYWTCSPFLYRPPLLLTWFKRKQKKNDVTHSPPFTHIISPYEFSE